MTDGELRMLDFCIDYFISELSEPEGVKTAEEIRSKFQIETGICYVSGSIDYIAWLENKILYASQFQEQPINQSVAYNIGLQSYEQPITVMDEGIVIKKISSGVYLKFHDELNLSLDDCEKITEFILKGYDDLIALSLKAQTTGLKKELINFLQFIEKHPELYRDYLEYHYMKIVNEYLSQYKPSLKAQKTNIK